MPVLSYLHQLFNAEQCQAYIGSVLDVEMATLDKQSKGIAIHK